MKKSWPKAGIRGSRRSCSIMAATALDAANLLMPLVFFLSPTDPRMLKTLDAINYFASHAAAWSSNSLVYRYNVQQTPDGLDGTGGHIQYVYLLACGSADPGRKSRSQPNSKRRGWCLNKC